jgi:hypothetical protein
LRIRALVLSVIVVLLLLVSIAPLPASENDNAVLMRGASASEAVQATGNETLWHDNFGDYYPTDFSQNPLINGTRYVITVEGTWSPWGASHWLSVDDPPVGAYEEAPMYLGNGGTGRVGMDPFYAFACIYGWDYASGLGWSSLPTPGSFRISLDNGASWTTSIRPENDVYTPTHKYELKVVGKGENIGFRTIDTEAYDNYGMFKIVIAPEQTSPSSPQNLTAVAGQTQVNLTWDAPSTDGGSPITNYTIYRGASPESLAYLAEVGVAMSYMDSNVTINQTYYFGVTATNGIGEGGLSNVVNCTLSWTEHHPICGITSPSGEYVNTSDIDMAWTMSDVVSGINYAQVRIDSESWISKGNATSHTFTGVSDGTHTLTLWICNNAGYNSSTSYAITVDTIPPTNVANSWSQMDASGTLSVTFSEAMGSVQGQVDGEPLAFSLLESIATATVTLTPGMHNLTMTGMDRAGNHIDYYAPFQFTVVEFTVQVSGRVVNGDGDPISGAQVDIDGVQTTTGTDGWFFCSVTPGQHDVSISATGMGDHSGQVTVTNAGGELGDFTMIPNEAPDDGGMDWLLIGTVAVVGVALLLLLLMLFMRRKKQ